MGDEPISDQRLEYEKLCARISAGKASQQEAVDAIRKLCLDNERLAVLLGKAKAALPAADARAEALREAAEVATARWVARREHADRLAELDYPEAMIDAKTVSAKADEAEMIAEQILALIPKGAKP